MNRMKDLWRYIRFSIGVQINLVLLFVTLSFIAFFVYNQSLLKQFNVRYQEEINQYYTILRLKKGFSECYTLFSEYLKTGNRSTLAEFNNSYKTVSTVVDELHHGAEDEEVRYLLRSIDQSFKAYYSECCSASFLYNTGNLDYFNRLSYSKTIIEYLKQYSDELLQFALELSVQNNQELTVRHSVMTYLNLVMAIIISFMLFVFGIYIHATITKPLNALANQAKELSRGNLEVHVKENLPDNNVGLLSRTFNTMADNIKTMMKSEQEKVHTEKKLLEEQRKNIEYEKLLNEARFIALQTQTNPHFLFNTLNSISRTITLGKEEQALTMIDSLVALLRYNLTDADIPVYLEQEITVVKEYLNIQKLRFTDRLEAALRVDQQLKKKIMLPRFTLQPLVENAIIHGLEHKEEGGKIMIDVKRRGNRAVIRICDNGRGIEKEKLRQIKQRLPGKKSREIGIWNTWQRMHLFTGNPDSLRIRSKPNKGTMIIITLLIIK